jgi:3-deoxy-D-manno-octulosonic-acid transferase
MDNFRDMAAQFDAADAWCRAADAEELAAAWSAWLTDPDEARRVGARARALVEENRGALDRTLDLLAPLLATAAEAGRR